MRGRKRGSTKHHLWIRIFVIVSVTVLGLLTLFAVIWQEKNRRYVFGREEEDIISSQYRISRALKEAVAFEALREGTKYLEEEEIKAAVESTIYYNLGQTALFRDGYYIAGTYKEEDDLDIELAGRELQRDCVLEYCKRDNKYYVKAVSALELQGEMYTLITTTDISKLYTYEKIMTIQILFVGIVGGGLILFCLGTIFRVSFLPLKEINKSVKGIAQGDYDRIVQVHARDELGELADNVNDMALAVRENINVLRERTREQKNFIDSMSEEMGVPLDSIVHYAEYIRDSSGLTRDEIKRYAEVIQEEGKRMKLTSRKLMNFIHIGRISRQDKKEIPVEEVLCESIENVIPMAQKKMVRIQKDIHDYTLNIERELFTTMICNYLDNAVYASEKNAVVEVAAYREGEQKIIKIMDHGIGIPEEELERVEKPFYRTQGFHDGENNGTGLGMALCRKIAEAHDGEVRIVSKVNEGTTIRLEFK